MISKQIHNVFNFLEKGYRAMELEKVEIVDLRNVLPRHKTKVWNKRPLSAIKEVYVHQAAGHLKAASAPGIDCQNTEDVNRYHISNACHIGQGTGCPRICYTISIERDGKIELCNNYTDVTWHAGKHNFNALSVLVCGNFSGPGWQPPRATQEPTSFQLKSLEDVINILIGTKELVNINGIERFFGHSNISASKPACPGSIIMELIDNWKKDV